MSSFFSKVDFEHFNNLLLVRHMGFINLVYVARLMLYVYLMFSVKLPNVSGENSLFLLLVLLTADEARIKKPQPKTLPKQGKKV